MAVEAFAAAAKEVAKEGTKEVARESTKEVAKEGIKETGLRDAGFKKEIVSDVSKERPDFEKAGRDNLKVKDYFSTYGERFGQTPAQGERGTWAGKRGESAFEPNNKEISDILAKYNTDKIVYNNCTPDFSPVSEATVKIKEMTENRAINFRQCDEACAKDWSKSFKGGINDWSPRDIADYRRENGLSWHERNDMKTCDLVHTKINDYFGHLGGVSECKKRDAGIAVRRAFDE